MPYCTYCGGEVLESDRFCSRCGNSIARTFQGRVYPSNERVSINPEAARMSTSLGWQLLNGEQYEEAHEQFQRAINLDKSSCEAWRGKACSLGALRLFDEALVSIDRTLELNPIYEDAWRNRGQILMEIGRNYEALLSLDKALEINPRDDRANELRDDVLIKLYGLAGRSFYRNSKEYPPSVR